MSALIAFTPLKQGVKLRRFNTPKGVNLQVFSWLQINHIYMVQEKLYSSNTNKNAVISLKFSWFWFCIWEALTVATVAQPSKQLDYRSMPPHRKGPTVDRGLPVATIRENIWFISLTLPDSPRKILTSQKLRKYRIFPEAGNLDIQFDNDAVRSEKCLNVGVVWRIGQAWLFWHLRLVVVK